MLNNTRKATPTNSDMVVDTVTSDSNTLNNVKGMKQTNIELEILYVNIPLLLHRSCSIILCGNGKIVLSINTVLYRIRKFTFDN